MIRFYNEDITKANIPGIVNAGNTSLWLGSGVAGAIRKNGGPSIQEELDLLKDYHYKNHRCELSEIVVTHGGDLPSAFVLHAAVMHSQGPDRGVTSDKIIYTSTRNAILKAHELNLWGLGLPLFGTGIGGVPYYKSAYYMLWAATRYAYNLQLEFYCFGTDALLEAKLAYKHVSAKIRWTP